MRSLKPITYLGDYIYGQFVLPTEKSGQIESINPGNLEDKIGVFNYSYNHVYEVVEAAQRAYPSWSRLSLPTRLEYLNKFYSEIESHLEDMTVIISRETGKPLWESKQEVTSLLGKIQISKKEGVEMISDKEVPNAQPNILGRYRFKPKGVLVVLGPFNFPAHLPHGHYIPALISGNTVIFKPSEKTPAVGQMIAEIVHRCGFPPGVFNMLQGEKEVGKRLVLSNVDGILFTGSYEVGLKIKQETVSHFWKTLALEMGGKNASIVLNDADLEKALYENILGAYLTTGQRCSATSRIILTDKIADSFLKEFHALSKGFEIGYAFNENPPFMGPLISKDARDNYLRFQGIAQREGGETVMRGKTLKLSPDGYYVTPSIYLMKPAKKTDIYINTEIFGPSVGVIIVKNVDEAIEEANKTDYGLAVSVFTNDEKAYQKVFNETKTGIVNWNRSTAGASSKLPFGGQGKSGNQSPTALFAPYYCTYPVSSLEDHASVDMTNIPPGFSFHHGSKVRPQ